MGQITKEFAETLLKRSQSGKHINTTVWEEEQLIRGWLYWNEHYFEPRIKAFVADQIKQGLDAVGGEAAQGSVNAALPAEGERK